jgi:hypothetical protein
MENLQQHPFKGCTCCTDGEVSNPQFPQHPECDFYILPKCKRWFGWQYLCFEVEESLRLYLRQSLPWLGWRKSVSVQDLWGRFQQWCRFGEAGVARESSPKFVDDVWLHKEGEGMDNNLSYLWHRILLCEDYHYLWYNKQRCLITKLNKVMEWHGVPHLQFKDSMVDSAHMN